MSTVAEHLDTNNRIGTYLDLVAVIELVRHVDENVTLEGLVEDFRKRVGTEYVGVADEDALKFIMANPEATTRYENFLRSTNTDTNISVTELAKGLLCWRYKENLDKALHSVFYDFHGDTKKAGQISLEFDDIVRSFTCIMEVEDLDAIILDEKAKQEVIEEYRHGLFYPLLMTDYEEDYLSEYGTVEPYWACTGDADAVAYYKKVEKQMKINEEKYGCNYGCRILVYSKECLNEMFNSDGDYRSNKVVEYMENEGFIDYSFDAVVKDFVIDGLDDWMGEGVYGCDLASLLCQDMNAIGSYYCNAHRSKQFIIKNWDKAEETQEYYRDELGVNLDVFNDVEGFMVAMLIKGVEDKLRDCEFVQENWNDKFKINNHVASEVMEEFGERGCYIGHYY